MMTRITLLLTVLIAFLSGCEDYLDKSPDQGITEEDVFAEYESARGFLDYCYTNLLDIHLWMSQDLRHAQVGCLSDEMISMISSHNSGISVISLNTGKWLNQPSLGEVGWQEHNNIDRTPVLAKSFINLRRTNKIIANLEVSERMSQEQVNELLGQAYFLRAWNYFQIIQRWGGMPIFDKVFSPNDDMDLKRLTYHESTEWLLSDLDRAIELLPHYWPDEQYGRATKGSAMALKSMAALYDASPLMQNDLNTLTNKGYDVARCELAAEYAHDVIQYLQGGAGGARYRLMDGSEYNNIFYHETFASDESLWFKMDGGRRNASRNIRGLYVPQRFENGGNGNDAANFCGPTQNIVDMFEVINDAGVALPITHPSSDYDPNDPYANRDPRLYNNIILPGEEWGVNNKGPLFMEMYVGGRDYNIATSNPRTSGKMITGYVTKKFIWPEANGWTRGWTVNRFNTVYIRVAQVYLDYAEAMNEAYGPTGDPKGYGLTAVDAINIVRNRVGMPDVASVFTGSKEAFRERIRNERAVELMFENHRWHDLRRWMIAEEVLAKPIRGMRATPNGAGGYDYNVVDLTTEQRVFASRQYWYPIAQDHIENLYNLQQNPGW